MRIHQITVLAPDLADGLLRLFIIAAAPAEFRMELFEHFGRNGIGSHLAKLLHIARNLRLVFAKQVQQAL